MRKVNREDITESIVFKFFMCILGGFLYSVGVNVFVRPSGVYTGGVMGLSQLIGYFVNLAIGRTTNVQAFIYIVFNIPLLVLAYKGVGRRFFVRTLLGVGSIFLFDALIPVPDHAVIENMLTGTIVGGMFTGVGTGIILIAGGCGGGADIVGVYISKKRPNASVGKFSLLFNLALYVALFFIFDFETVIYSIIVSVAFSFSLDRIHVQNIAMRCMIFTKKEGMEKEILTKTGRGVTRWEGIGAYTGEGMHVLVSVINKYEEREFMEEITEIDPHAFVIMDEHVKVHGNFVKKL